MVSSGLDDLFPGPLSWLDLSADYHSSQLILSLPTGLTELFLWKRPSELSTMSSTVSILFRRQYRFTLPSATHADQLQRVKLSIGVLPNGLLVSSFLQNWENFTDNGSQWKFNRLLKLPRDSIWSVLRSNNLITLCYTDRGSNRNTSLSSDTRNTERKLPPFCL